MRVNPLLSFAAIASMTTVGLLGTSAVNGAALFFYKTTVKTSSEATCYAFARDTARLLGFTNVRSNNLEVAGQKDGAYISITCIGRGSGLQAVAVVMSVADNFDVAKRAGTLAGEKIKGIICFDEPC
ncbi:hypothetical protein [Chroococcus sp. FPU101]|uniref:hypothetical protein n=1 Tax=Chroococcus sp. FPU101 TaxID=1974212 RepID=UPI001A9052EF|nr:hypothetical protein [Chroococcus sp. FPU101]GFE72135.1 hypothetical protein CFPU101_47450 [Chroococcus sp. FPU101]